MAALAVMFPDSETVVRQGQAGSSRDSSARAGRPTSMLIPDVPINKPWQDAIDGHQARPGPQ